MDRIDVLNMYKKGYSIEYIINKFYNTEKAKNKLINTTNKKIIIINTPIKRSEVKGQVYRIIYEEKKQKDRPI